VGDQVNVIYDPRRPEEAKVAVGSMFRIDPKALLAAAAIFLGRWPSFSCFSWR